MHTHTREGPDVCSSCDGVAERDDLLIEYAEKGLAGGALMALQAGADVNPANSTTAPAGMYRGATPIIPKGYMWSCPGRAARPRSWSYQETVTRVSTEPRCRLGLPIRLGVGHS
jgi:hypothetical protein